MRKHSITAALALLIGAGILSLLFALAIQPFSTATASPDAAQQLADAWQRAGAIGRYRYHATVLQTSHPALTLQNVGRTAHTDQFVIAGEMDTPGERMTLQLTVANQPPLQIKVENGRGYGRVRDADPWTETEIATELFAPGGDPLGFLVAAENVRKLGRDAADAFFPAAMLPADYAQAITRYQFDMNGVKYAQAMRTAMEAFLRTQGALPAGVSLQMAQQYVAMTGSGEIWINSDGLPVRQIMRLAFPPRSGDGEKVEAAITTEFSNWAASTTPTLSQSWNQPGLALHGILDQVGARQAQQAGVTLGLLLIVLALVGLALHQRHSLALRRAVYGVVIASLVIVPLLQSAQTAAAYDRLADLQSRAADKQLSTSDKEEKATFDPRRAPLTEGSPSIARATTDQTNLQSLASTCVITASSDCDGDGLTDNVEIYELGADIEMIDTDGDGISDGREVKPFHWFGTWYLDPLQADTNGDGIDDGEECFTRADVSGNTLVAIDDVPCPDRDMDEVPDVFDFDNDGDGVPDAVDISPNDAQVVEDNQRFQLKLVGAQTAKNLLVDLQLRPIDDSHLGWTNSILDWRDNDNLGQIQRMTPNVLGAGSGDIQLMPMLEISIPYSPTNPAAGLPVTGTPTITATTPISTWLDSSLTAPYAINVWLGKDGARNVALPLMQVTDPTGGAPVAWQARMPYRLQSGITDWGAAHEMRVVWYVQGQVDNCAPPAGAAADYCTKSENWVSGKTLLQTYPESFRITGLSITEQHDTTAFLAGQAISGNSPAYPDQLWHLADVLQQSWLRGASVNGTRFPLTDVAATLGAWGINNLSTRTLPNLGDEVALLKAVNLETARNFIESDLYPSAPAVGKMTTVLLAGEESGRSAFLGGVEQIDSNALVKRTSYANTVLTVDLTGAAVTTQAILRWQPYRFDGASWQAADLGNYLTQLETALTSVFTQAKLQEYGLLEGANPSDALADVQAGAIFLAQSFYIATMAGVNTVVGSGSVPGPGSTPLDNSRYAALSDPALAIVQAMAGKVQNVFTVLNRTGLDIPTVDANIESKAATAWQRLSQSTAAVLAAYGQVAGGVASSVISQALAEMSKSTQISLESGEFVHLYDGGLIFATAGAQAMTTQVGASGGLANTISVIWAVGSPAMATYSHLWYLQMASMTQLRSALMISAAGRQALGNIQQLETTVAALKTKIGQLSTELAQAAPPPLSESASSFAYKQKARANMNFYIRDARFAENIVAAELGFEIKDGEWFQQNPLYQQYKALNNDLASTKLSRDLLIGDLNAEKARLQRSFGVSLDQVAPEAALKIKRTAAKWAVIGVATSVATAGLTIGATLAGGALDPDSPAFAQLVAEQISSVIIDTFIAVLDVLVVVANFARLGTALVILAVIDLVIAVVCVATNLDEKDPTVASWICGGFSGALAKALSLVIGDVTPLVDLGNPNRMQMELFPPVLGAESGVDGLVVGNSITFSGTVTNTLFMGNPSWKSAYWRGQWSDDNLDDATFAYQFQARERDIPLVLNGTTWQPYPGKKGAVYGANDARFLAQIPIQSLSHNFSAPGSNQSLPMSLAEGFAVRQQSCWLLVAGYFCWLTTYDDTVHLPLDNSFIFDVLPASIDGFRTLIAQNNNAGEPGYRLAWDDAFPILADADNDGLRSQAKGGIDPDDNNPDTDADGLSDAFEELNAGFDPLNSDSDCDGLTDYWEAFYGTDPSRPDSDGDGLTDNEEHFHPNQLYPYDASELENYRAPTCSAAASYYAGGWSIVYGYDSSGNPLTTWVSADPLDADSDDDALNDKQERIYAFNPNVASDLNVLSLYSTIESSSGALPYVAPSGSISYTALITNELTLPYARGLLEAELPLDSVRRNQPTGAIAPRSTVNLTGNIALAEAGLTASGPTQMGVRAGAIIEDPTGRSLWLHLNEPAGSTTFVDSSFLGNNATCAGAACPAANGTILTFDGNDNVTVPHSAAVDLAQYTVALWVKPTATNEFSSANLLDKRGTNGANYQLTLRPVTSQVQFATAPCTIGGGDVLSSPAGLPLNQWSHVVATYDGAIKRLYVNGMLVNSQSYSGGLCRTTDPLAIGGQIAGFIPFTGQMDEIEIYPLALDQGTVSARYGAPALQVDLRNSTTWGSSAVTCSGSRCPSAGGDGAAFRQENYLSATAPNLSGDAFAFAMWIKPQPRRAPMNSEVATAYGKETNRDWQGVFGNMVYDGSQTSWPQASTIYPSLFVSNDGALRMLMGDGASTCQLTTNAANVVQQNRWQFLVVSYDGSNFTFYINGRAVDGGVSGQSCAGVTPPTVANFYIGRPNDYGYPWVDRLELVDPTLGQLNPSVNLNSDAGAGNIWKTIATGPDIYTIKKSFRIGDAVPNQWIRLYQDDRGDGGFDPLTTVSSNIPDTSLVQITGINSFNNLGLSGHPFHISSNNFGLAVGTLYFGVFNDYFQGSLDQFQVYPFALNAERVTALYNSVAVALDLPFDEAPGADLFADASGNFASVACSGATCPVGGVPGRRNQAIQFDGVDDYLILGSSTDDLGFTSSDFSVMMWIKPADFLGSFGNGLVPLMEIGDFNYIGLSNGRMTVQGAVLAQAKDSLYNATERWYHLAYVYDRRAARYTLYLNGRAIWQQSYGVPGKKDSLQIGRWSSVSGSNYYYNGLLDDLTVVKRALSQAEVQAHFNRAPAVNLHLDEDLSRTTFVDDSNNRFAATCSSTSSPTTDACPDAADKGQMREAVTFDGNDTLTLSATAAMTLTNFSVGMWVKPTKTVNTVQWLATKADGNFYNANFRLSIQPNSMTVRFERQSACAAADTNWHRVGASNPLLEDQWNHVVATHSATDGVMAIYVNGSLAGTATGIGGSVCTATNAIRLGQAFNGGMDEVSIYKTALNAGQVADAYQYQAAWFDVIDRHDLYVDADLPTVDLSRTPAYVGAAQTVLTVRADDASSPLAGVEYRIDGGAWQAATPGNGTAATSGAWLFNFQAAGGAHTLEARATDSVGNLSAIASAAVTVDAGAPGVSVNSPAGVLRITDSLVISGTASDGASGLASNGVSVRLADHTGADVTGAQVASLGVNGAWQAAQPFDTSPYGVYTATATAGDEAGNASTAAAIYNLDSLPPFADVTDGGHFYSPVDTKTMMGVAGDTPYPAGGRTLHLHFETGSGLWEDGSPTGYTMQCSGASCPSAGVSGKHGAAVTFDGVDDLLDFSGNAAVTITTTARQLGLSDGSFTVMAWVNAADWSGSRALLGTGPADGLFVGIQNGSPFLGYGGDDTTMTGAIPTGQWVHLAWRFNAASGERTFFVNGKLGAAATAGHLPYSAEDAVQVGRARGGNAFAGSVDELAIYDQPLPDETIYDIANPLDVGVSSLALRVRSYAQRDFGQYEGVWIPVTLNGANSPFTTWQATLPALPTGAYKLDLQVTDAVGNSQFVEGAWDFAIMAPDMAVSKQGTAVLAGLGDSVGFNITYTNTGAVPATNVVLTETVPVDASFDPALSHSGWACTPDGAAGSACTLAVGDVPVGGGGSVAYAVTVGNAWSAGTTAIVNTVAVGAAGGENTPADNLATAQVPADAEIDLAVSLVDDGTAFQYTTEGSSAVVYTMSYTNTGTQPAHPQLTVLWSQGGERNPFDPDTNWLCVTDPYTLEGANTCTRDLGTLGIGQSGAVTFTLYTGYFLPDSLSITTTVQIADLAGGNEVNTTNNMAAVATPIQVDYAVVLDLPAISAPEGAVATNGGLLLTPPYDPEFPPLFALYPAPSAGTYTSRDDANLTWTWAYTSTDGPDQSQIVVWNVVVGEGAFTLKPSFVMTITNVPPSVSITGPDTVATGALIDVTLGDLIDPGQDTMIDCNLFWGDGTSDDCFSAVGGGILGHIYGPTYRNPTLTVEVTDEDGVHVAGSKTIAVTGVSTALNVDQTTVGGDESQTLSNSGSYSPHDGGFSWSASEGVVSDAGNGRWSWSLPAGSAEGSRTVTINAGGQSVNFTVNVQGDGVNGTVEAGAPNGGDGNNDGIPDNMQLNVASLPSPLTGQYVTIATAPGLALTNVSFPATPVAGAGQLPANARFPLGFPTFNLTGMGAGGRAQVTLYLTSSSGINSYYKYDDINGWYRFRYDNATKTGAELRNDRIILYLQDGVRGDSDHSANGVIADPGGPAYETPFYNLTVDVSGNGAVSVPSGSYGEGAVLTLQVSEAPGWSFQSWSGALSGNLNSQTITMDQDKVVTAIFTQDAYSLGRRVVSSGRIDVDPDRSSYRYGDGVSVSATPATGWHFDGWSGDLSGNRAGASLTMDGDKTVTATFVRNQYTVSANGSGGGNVVLNPQQAAYGYGDLIYVDALPAPGYVFQGWSGDLSGEGSGRQLLVDGNKALTAHFAPATYVIESAVTGNGSITLDPAKATYVYGDVVEVSAVAASGWRLAAWAAGLSGDATVQTLTVTDDTALLAVFAQDAYVLNVGWIGEGTAQKLTDQSAFTLGEVVTVTATPTGETTFSGWRDEASNTIFSSELTTTVTVTGDRSIVALFGIEQTTPPVIALSAPTATMHYSDGGAPITVTITDADSAGATLQLDQVRWTADGVTFNDGLPGQLALSAPNSNGLTLPGVVTYTLSGFIDQPAGTYTITLTPRDEALVGDSAVFVLKVLPEESMFRFRGNQRAVQVAAFGDKVSGPFELAVDVTERYPDNGVVVAPGDLALAKVQMQLAPIGPGGTVNPSICAPVSRGAGYDAHLTLTCAFSSVPLNTYAVAVTVSGGYYAGSDEDVVTIYDPSLGFTNGGGAFDWPGSSDATSFGFSIEYNKNGKNVKGRLLVTRRLADGAVYQLKSNSLDGLTLSAEGGYTWTTFSGKATYLAPGMTSPAGNYTFIVYAEDHGEAGDRFWLQVKDKKGNVVTELSLDEPAAANAASIGDGNIVVPGSAASAAQPSYSLYLPFISNNAQMIQSNVSSQAASHEPDHAILLPIIERH
ncbi:MAG: LamG-like jellyroll fold domain-containing protein [Caldilineaceae bacterium]